MSWAPIAAYALAYDAWAIRRGLPTLCARARRLAGRHPDVRAAMAGAGVAFLIHVLCPKEPR